VALLAAGQEKFATKSDVEVAVKAVGADLTKKIEDTAGALTKKFEDTADTLKIMIAGAREALRRISASLKP
jgi:hypothetical protein